MKKSIIILFALLLSVSAFSQQELRANEIKLNLSNTTFFRYPEISYERILNTDTASPFDSAQGTQRPSGNSTKFEINVAIVE